MLVEVMDNYNVGLDTCILVPGEDECTNSQMYLQYRNILLTIYARLNSQKI